MLHTEDREQEMQKVIKLFFPKYSEPIPLQWFDAWQEWIYV
jgi:hypothetical protein